MKPEADTVTAKQALRLTKRGYLMYSQDLLPEVIKFLREHYADPLQNGKERKMLQLELANMLGVDVRVVKAWERGNYIPSNEYLVMMSRIFGVSFQIGCEKVHPSIWERVQKIGRPDEKGIVKGIPFEEIPMNTRHIRIKTPLAIEPLPEPPVAPTGT